MGGNEGDEEREEAVEIAIKAGLLKRCEDHEYVLDAEVGDDDDPYEAAEALGLDRAYARQLVDAHGIECPGCVGRLRD